MSAMRLSKWLTYVWILAAVAIFLVAIRACAFFAADYPHRDVLPFQPNFPRLNPHPMRSLLITGTMPSSLPIRFVAYYAATLPRLGQKGYRSCYRSVPLGPSPPLHVTEPLQIVRHGVYYEASVTVDKYEPGYCGWRLASVTYEVLNSLEYGLRGTEAGWIGSPVVAFLHADDNVDEHGGYKFWMGRLDVWCIRERLPEKPQFPQICGVLRGLGPRYDALPVPAAERGDNMETYATRDTRTVEINFHDLNAWMAEHAARR